MNTRDRVLKLIEAEGLTIGAAPDQCWIDSRVRCPYGKPEGSYINRPRAFCGSGCQYFRDGNIRAMCDNKHIVDHFEEEHVSVVSELQERAGECEPGSAEQHMLLGAADIIKAKEFDRDILLRDDLPEYSSTTT